MFYIHMFYCLFFFFNDTATTEIYTLSLHDALPISAPGAMPTLHRYFGNPLLTRRSEEHTSELQSLAYLVCRLLLEKKKKIKSKNINSKKKKKKNKKNQTKEKT